VFTFVRNRCSHSPEYAHAEIISKLKNNAKDDSSLDIMEFIEVFPQNFDFNKETPNSNQTKVVTDLFSAVTSGNFGEVKQLLEEGANVSKRYDRNATSLFWAAAYGHKDISELLIESGADTNSADEYGFTPLHVAAYNIREAVVQLLIKKGADVNVRSTNGYTPLFKAMEKFFDPEVRDQIKPHEKENAINIVESLLKAGAEQDARVVPCQYPIHLAAASGEERLISLFIDRNVDINAKGREGVTPLYIAVQTGPPSTIQFLLDRGAQVDSVTKSGFTPLFQAAVRGSNEITKLLIAKGADVNHKDNDSTTPLIGTIKVAVGFQEKKEVPKEVENLILGLEKEWKEVVRILLRNGADTNAITKNHDTALVLAIYLNDKEIVEELLNHGANTNYAGAGETALHAAIAEGHFDISAILVKRGADVNAVNMSNRTSLHFLAAYSNNSGIAKLMIDHGANVNAKDKYGRTPLHYAAKKGNLKVADVIRRHGGM